MKTALAHLLALSLTGLTGCVAGLGEGAVRGGEPPAPLPEFRTTPPVPGMIWVPGAWHWSGTEDVWIPGRWESPPPPPVTPSP